MHMKARRLMRLRSSICGLLGARRRRCLGAASASAAAAASSGPHRAVYDLSLGDGAAARAHRERARAHRLRFHRRCLRGLCAELPAGDASSTAAETGPRTSDVRTTTFEAGDGRTCRFKTESRHRRAARPRSSTARPSAGRRRLIGRAARRRKADSIDASPATRCFRPRRCKRLIEAAPRRPADARSVKVFDGSDDGQQGLRHARGDRPARSTPASASRRGSLRRTAHGRSCARWPVTISYFKVGQGEPARRSTRSRSTSTRTASAGALKLDYGDFALQRRAHASRSAARQALRE